MQCLLAEDLDVKDFTCTSKYGWERRELTLGMSQEGRSIFLLQ